MPPIAVLVALADPTRCRIIELLRTGPMPVHRIAAAFDISRPAVSRHLAILKLARLVSESKSGRENLYALQSRRLRPVVDWLASIASAPRPQSRPTTATTTLGTAVPSPRNPATSAARRPLLSSQMGFDF